jgi:hypothetical protein
MGIIPQATSTGRRRKSLGRDCGKLSALKIAEGFPAHRRQFGTNPCPLEQTGGFEDHKRTSCPRGSCGRNFRFARDSGCTSARASRKGYDGLIFHCWRDLFCAGLLGTVLCFAHRMTFAAFLCVSV